MKKYIAKLLIVAFSLATINAQSFQRMAIAKGSYKLGARGSSKATAYCLDYSRKAPVGGMDYGNILGGGASAVVEIASSSESISRMSLDDAINRGYVGIEGASLFGGNAKEVLEDILKTGRQNGENVADLEMLLESWDDLPASAKLEIENQLTEASGFGGLGNHTALNFVNKTDNQIEIKLNENLQLGDEGERVAIGGINDLELSADPLMQDDIQRGIVWAKRETDNLEKLKRLGFYEGNTKVDAAGLEDVKYVYKDFQEEFGVRTSGEDFGVFDELTEMKVNEELGKLGSELKEIGLEGNLESAIKNYQAYKGYRRDGYFSKSLRESLYDDIDRGIFFSRKKVVYQTRIIRIGDDIERVFELEPNLYVKFKQKDKIDEIVGNLNSRKYLQEEVELISLVKDGATQDVLKANFPENHLSFDIPSMRGLISKLKNNKQKSVIVLGHIEGKEFVTALENGNSFRLSLDDLKRLGEEFDVNIFPLGCNSGSFGSGIGNKFNSIDALNRLKPAVENNTQIMGMLTDLAGVDLVVVLDDIPFQDRGYLQAKIQAKRKSEGLTALVEIGAGGLIMYGLSQENED